MVILGIILKAIGSAAVGLILGYASLWFRGRIFGYNYSKKVLRYFALVCGVLFLVLTLSTGCSRMNPAMSQSRSVKGEQYDIADLLLLNNRAMLSEEIRNGMNIKGANGSKAFRMALENSRSTLAYDLVDLGVDVTYQDNAGVTDFMYVYDNYRYSEDLVKFTEKFLKAGGDIKHRDNEGYSIIDRLLLYSRFDFMQTYKINYLLNQGILIDQTAIYAAVHSTYYNYNAIYTVFSHFNADFHNIKPNSCIEAVILQKKIKQEVSPRMKIISYFCNILLVFQI